MFSQDEPLKFIISNGFVEKGYETLKIQTESPDVQIFIKIKFKTIEEMEHLERLIKKKFQGNFVDSNEE